MDTDRPTLWIDAAVLEWAPEFLSGTYQGRERLLRPHQILEHATRILTGQLSSFALADVVSNLKRAVNSRLSHLEELYHFTTLFPKSVGALERLEGVGLAKPLLIRQLFELRNDIEHKDALPPSKQRCGELVDATWYFLKTTDNACKTAVSGVSLQCESGEYAREPYVWLSVRLTGGEAADPNINGWLPAALLHERPLPGALPVEVHRTRSKTSRRYSDGTLVAPNGASAHADRKEDERYLAGTLVAPDALKRTLWTLALQSL